MENNEKLDWKPEVGKTAWLKRYPYTIEQVMIIADGSTKLHYRQNYSIGEGEVAEYYSAQDRDYFFESKNMQSVSSLRRHQSKYSCLSIK